MIRVGYGYDVSSNAWPCTMKEWKKEHVERMQRMVEYHKNHACIIMWSTGNESGHGSNHFKMIEYLRSVDSSWDAEVSPVFNDSFESCAEKLKIIHIQIIINIKSIIFFIFISNLF
mgnify:CR=1 FL=1